MNLQKRPLMKNMHIKAELLILELILLNYPINIHQQGKLLNTTAVSA